MEKIHWFFIGWFSCGIAAWITMEIKYPPVTKTCYITKWKWEKSSNGVRVRVPKTQVCVKGDVE